MEKMQKIHWITLAAVILFLPMERSGAEARLVEYAAVSSAAADGQASDEFESLLKALQGSDAYERHRAAIALGRSGNPKAVDPLVAALADQDPFVRSFAATALGNLGDRRAVPPLIKALTDKEMIVRRAAVTALGGLKDADAVDPLIQRLDDESPLVQRAAAEALGDLGDPKAVPFLLKALKSEDLYIRNGAALALSKIGGAAVPGLVRALGDRDAGPAAAEILRSLNWQPASDEEKVRFDVARRNIKALLDNWDNVRKVLLSDTENGDDSRVQNAVYALIGIGRDDVLDELDKILRARGTVEMAAAFLQSGNARLSKAAESWAKEQGKEIKSGNNPEAVLWAGWRTSAGL